MPGDKEDYVAPETNFEQMYHDAERDNSIYVSQIKSLNTSDKDAEIIRLSLLCDQLDGRRIGKTNTKNEAQKQAKYYGDLLAKIRKVLNVDSNSKILAALEAR
jgi:CRISPR/Cas system CSM-associated protein Csm5 (group 7 of RAMP superfamily)